ncbi:MAG: hypothetical protein COC21_07305 [Verrucomicrobiales bacterium]|nr:MAG: hypothetical protein COC21_07305 [Verrucomicrobiales bacterium]
MKHLLITTIAAVVLVGCGESQQSAPAPEATPVEPVAEVPSRPSPPPVEAKPDEPIAEASQPEPPSAKAPDISIHKAAERGNIEAVKQHLDTGEDVNAKNDNGYTPLHSAAYWGRKEVAALLIGKGADVNATDKSGATPLGGAIRRKHLETAALIRKHGGKTGEELKAAGN